MDKKVLYPDFGGKESSDSKPQLFDMQKEAREAAVASLSEGLSQFESDYLVLIEALLKQLAKLDKDCKTNPRNKNLIETNWSGQVSAALPMHKSWIARLERIKYLCESYGSDEFIDLRDKALSYLAVARLLNWDKLHDFSQREAAIKALSTLVSSVEQLKQRYASSKQDKE